LLELIVGYNMQPLMAAPKDGAAGHRARPLGPGGASRGANSPEKILPPFSVEKTGALLRIQLR